jgi:hypothetical protein
MRTTVMLATLLAFALSGCAFHSTANDWSQLVGSNGEPVYIKSTSSVGLNLGILLRVFGATDIDGLVEEMTEKIAEEGGDRVRVIQSGSENYWYGFPPFTWFVTPVITTVTAEYEPSEEQFAADQAERDE